MLADYVMCCIENVKLCKNKKIQFN